MRRTAFTFLCTREQIISPKAPSNEKLHCNALPVFVPGMFYISDAASLNPFIRREIILWREMVGLQETKQMLAAASKRRGASLLPGGSTGTSNKLHELRQILSAAS